jgi:peroxiredoxin
MATASRQIPLAVGDPAPWFECRTRRRADYSFSTVAGRYVVLCFLGSGALPQAEGFLKGLRAMRGRFDDEQLSFFGVTTDAADLERDSMRDAYPGIRFFFDLDRAVSGLYGALAPDGAPRPLTYLLDTGLRVMAAFSGADAATARALASRLDQLPPLPEPFAAPALAPVLVLPRVFEPALCRELIAYYDTKGGGDSGFMQERDGITKGVIDYGFKRRRDCSIDDDGLLGACRARVNARLIPETLKAYQVHLTRMERYIVACYDAREGGYFRAHRDNGTKATAHRRFAVSLFLNTHEYDGGFLRFPEFGRALYSAPAGGAVIFSCSLLHEATPVTRGRRYMFLPFLYDDASARVREDNLPYLDSSDVLRLT